MQKPCADRIKGLLQEWAGYDTPDIPPEVARLNHEICRLAPTLRKVVLLEYWDSRPQKTKAAMIGITREGFSNRLRFIHEQLDFAMFSM